VGDPRLNSTDFRFRTRKELFSWEGVLCRRSRINDFRENWSKYFLLSLKITNQASYCTHARKKT